MGDFALPSSSSLSSGLYGGGCIGVDFRAQTIGTSLVELVLRSPLETCELVNLKTATLTRMACEWHLDSCEAKSRREHSSAGMTREETRGGKARREEGPMHHLPR